MDSPSPTFAQAREAWLRRWHEDARLTHADRAVVTQVFLHFNTRHFERTGELLAWPGWETVATEGRLSKASVFRGFRRLEQLGALAIEHGRYNHGTKKRAGNIYRGFPDQGFRVRPSKVSNRDKARFQGETRLVDRDSTNRDSSIEERHKEFNDSGTPGKEASKEANKEARSLPRKQVRKEERRAGPTAPSDNQSSACPYQNSEGVLRGGPGYVGSPGGTRVDSYELAQALAQERRAAAAKAANGGLQ
jgi:hypothetical protein